MMCACCPLLSNSLHAHVAVLVRRGITSVWQSQPEYEVIREMAV